MLVPDVSVIVTCYNLERYVAESIQSALDQQFVGEVEIIVVDDCSTDGSRDVIRRFSDVLYVRTASNSGVLLATIAGLQAASADVVFFLDADDVWEKEKLSTATPVFAANPSVGFVTHDLVYVDRAGEPLERPSRPQAVLGSLAPDDAARKVRAGILELGDYVWLGSAFGVRKSAIDVRGFLNFAGTLADPANTYQDWPLAFWIAAQPNVGFAYVPQKLLRYRVHESNHSGDARTLERSIRNLTRTLNTDNAILSIARLRHLPGGVLRIVQGRIAFTQYRINLARGRRAHAVRGFIRSAADLSRRGVLLKEFVRFVAVQALGPHRFAQLATRRKILRNLPVS